MENIITDKLLFDKKVFAEKLKKSSNPLSIFKEALNNGYEYLTSNFIPGENIEFLVKQQTWLIDQLLMFVLYMIATMYFMFGLHRICTRDFMIVLQKIYTMNVIFVNELFN